MLNFKTSGGSAPHQLFSACTIAVFIPSTLSVLQANELKPRLSGSGSSGAVPSVGWEVASITTALASPMKALSVTMPPAPLVNLIPEELPVNRTAMTTGAAPAPETRSPGPLLVSRVLSRIVRPAAYARTSAPNPPP